METEEKKCAKCGGLTTAGVLNSYGGGVKWDKHGTWWWSGQRIVAYKCEKCKYIELYTEKRS